MMRAILVLNIFCCVFYSIRFSELVLETFSMFVKFYMTILVC